MSLNRATNFPNGIRTPGTEQISSYLGTVISAFGEIKTNIREPVIELKSNYGLSALRDVQIVTNTGAISNDGSEYKLVTGATTASAATLESAERGRYVPGVEAQAGIGVRLDHTFTGTQKAEWGYFDTQDGFGFGADADGLYVFVRRAGVSTKTYRADWNGDKADGKGPTETTLTLSKGNIFSVNFVWYGYGVVEFSTFLQGPDGNQIKVVLHRFSPSEQTSVADPNLPVTATVSNGDTTADVELYVGGRQFSIYSDYIPNRRVNAQERYAKTGVGETFLPLVSFRKKAAFKSVSVKVEGLDAIVSADMAFQIRVNPTLTDASFVTPTDTTAAETACEVDVSATAVTGGQILYKGLVSATGSGNNQKGEKSAQFDFDVPGEQIITLCVRRIAGVDATASSVLRWLEEW